MCMHLWQAESGVQYACTQYAALKARMLLSCAAPPNLAGARGKVVSAVDGSPLPATIVVEGIRRNITASQQLGYYNR